MEYIKTAKMHPIICHIGPFNVYAYGFMLAVAFLAGSKLAGMRAKKSGLDPDVILNLCFLVFIAGVLGARIFYVSYNLSHYWNNPAEIIIPQQGGISGLSWFGGLFFGVAAGVIYLKKKRLSIYMILDLLAPFVALAQSIGRIGCLLNGCCFGKASAAGVYFETHGSFLVPTQAYSSFLLLIIYIVLRLLQERPHKAGEIFFTYLLLYSIKRFFIEFLRDDSPVIALGLTMFQLISVLIFILAGIKLIFIRRVK